MRAHTCITNNEIVDTLANNGALKYKKGPLSPPPLPLIDMAHTTPYWLQNVSFAMGGNSNHNLHTLINKEHNISKHARRNRNTEKWLCKEYINHKIPNFLWKTPKTSNLFPNKLIINITIYFYQPVCFQHGSVCQKVNNCALPRHRKFT